MYVYQEYPKCLYRRSGETVTVANAEEESLVLADGYMTAEQFHGVAHEPEPEPEKKKKATRL